VADAAVDVRAIAEDLGIDRLFVWGLSGGGPPTLACAALLPDLVRAAGVVASPAPWGASGLDYFEGMGEDNVREMKLYLDDPEAARAKGAELRQELLAASPQTLAEAWKSLLSDADAAVVTDDFAEFIVRCIQDGLATTHEGWADDGESQMEPWGFELESIRVPVKLWHGRHDRFVPFQHGQWLASRIPGIESDLSENDGHLTLLTNRVPEVHAWLLEHDDAAVRLDHN
jgi:pimeloyl-ACP methyl ester carboxylesterase